MAKLVSKSLRAVLMELRRIEKLRARERVRVERRGSRSDEHDDRQFQYLLGVHQALAWAAGDNAARPSSCVILRRRPRRRKP